MISASRPSSTATNSSVRPAAAMPRSWPSTRNPALSIWKAACPGFSDWGVGYSSLVVSEACGIRQYVTLLGHGLVGVAAKDGKFLWGYQRIANSHTSIPTPIIRGDYVFAVNGYGAGACVVKLCPDGWRHEGPGGLVPQFRQVPEHVRAGGRHRRLHLQRPRRPRRAPICVKFATGKIMWKQGENPPGHGVAHVLAIDGLIIYRYIDARRRAGRGHAAGVYAAGRLQDRSEEGGGPGPDRRLQTAGSSSASTNSCTATTSRNIDVAAVRLRDTVAPVMPCGGAPND